MRLLLITLAAFYCAFALTKTHGPYHLFERFRTRFPFGGATTCIVCAMPYFALFFFICDTLNLEAIVMIFAAAGGALSLWRYTGADHA